MYPSGRSLCLTFALLTALVALSAGPVSAASAFAIPAFQQQWQTDEARVPNYWGPLSTAHDGMLEAYAEGTAASPCAATPGAICTQVIVDGKRVVQYFDKGRMELNEPGAPVTSGLLATELVRGQIQIGNSTFQAKPPPAIAIAGDPSTTGATYAALATTASMLLQPAQAMPGIVSFNQVNADGTVTSQAISPSDPLKYATYDAATKHNVPQTFAQFRDNVGLSTIGYAISEPFQTNVMVGGKSQYLTAQVFERRVLTYTAGNPAAFQVEFGNIGQHYYQWRYPGGAPAT